MLRLKSDLEATNDKLAAYYTPSTLPSPWILFKNPLEHWYEVTVTMRENYSCLNHFEIVHCWTNPRTTYAAYLGNTQPQQPQSTALHRVVAAALLLSGPPFSSVKHGGRSTAVPGQALGMHPTRVRAASFASQSMKLDESLPIFFLRLLWNI